MEKERPIKGEEQPNNLITNGESKEVKNTDRVYIGKTKDGAEVYDRADSHLHVESGMTPELAAETLSQIDTKGRFSIKEIIKYDRIVGINNCVEVGPEDDIVMAYREKRSGQTPMVKNRKAKPSNSTVMIIKKDPSVRDKNVYEIKTGYVGEEAPKEPWDPSINNEAERNECKEFWRTHALIYDDKRINWEKTKDFEFMSSSEKEKELIRPKVMYTGFFVDSDELYGKMHPTLEKPIKTPHVTTAFKPELSQLNLDQLGVGVKITAIGYGNDGNNEGLLVKVDTDDPALQEAIDAVKTPHITLSISKKGQAVKTAFLDFSPLDEPFEIMGQYGLFVQGAPVFNRDELNKDTTE